jgi:hypothetical protein
MDTFVAINPPPGLYRQGTNYQSKGRWRDANLVRFFQGTIRPIGGWQRLVSAAGAPFAAVEGVPRGVTSWAVTDNEFVTAIGTTSDLYAIKQGVLYQITPDSFNVGGEDAEIGGDTGGAYGEGLYGDGLYGGAGTGIDQITAAGVWQFDTFGDFLVAIATHDKNLYVWEGDTSNDATLVDNAPSGEAVVTTPERFVFVLGADGDVRQVAWASQESLTDWAPTDENSAGSQILPTNGRLLCGRRSKGQTLLWTTVDCWTATYIGEPFIYRFDLVGESCGAVSPQAPVMVDTMAFWMGDENFFVYDGFVRPLPCDVHDYVFGDFNKTQASKVWGVTTAKFGEVTWFYPSALSLEVDRYVTFNYREKHWTYGQLARSAGTDAGPSASPIWADASGVLWQHETGSLRPGAGAVFAETGPVELTSGPRGLTTNPEMFGAGDQTMLAQRIVPDDRFLGDLRAYLYSALFPTDTEVQHGPFSTTQPTFMRVRGRTVRLRLEAASANSDWRAGIYRIGVVPSSRR